MEAIARDIAEAIGAELMLSGRREALPMVWVWREGAGFLRDVASDQTTFLANQVQAVLQSLMAVNPEATETYLSTCVHFESPDTGCTPLRFVCTSSCQLNMRLDRVPFGLAEFYLAAFETMLKGFPQAQGNTFNMTDDKYLGKLIEQGQSGDSTVSQPI